MNKFACVVIVAVLATTSACKKVDSVKVSDATMTRVSDEFLAAPLSGDIARDDALYAKDVIAVDPMSAELIVGADAMHKSNQGFIDMKLDKLRYVERRFQALNAEDFVVTAKIHGESSTGSVKTLDFRVTDLFRKQDDDSFKVISEHASFEATAPK